MGTTPKWSNPLISDFFHAFVIFGNWFNVSFIDFYCVVLLPSLTSDLPQLARSDTVLAAQRPTPTAPGHAHCAPGSCVWDLNREIMYSPYFTLFIAIFNTARLASLDTLTPSACRECGWSCREGWCRGRIRGRPLYVTIMLPWRWAQSNCLGHKNQKVFRLDSGIGPFAWHRFGRKTPLIMGIFYFI